MGADDKVETFAFPAVIEVSFMDGVVADICTGALTLVVGRSVHATWFSNLFRLKSFVLCVTILELSSAIDCIIFVFTLRSGRCWGGGNGSNEYEHIGTVSCVSERGFWFRARGIGIVPEATSNGVLRIASSGDNADTASRSVGACIVATTACPVALLATVCWAWRTPFGLHFFTTSDEFTTSDCGSDWETSFKLAAGLRPDTGGDRGAGSDARPSAEEVRPDDKGAELEDGRTVAVLS